MSEPSREGIEIRPERAQDFPRIAVVVERAFGGPVEAELVRLIRSSPNYVPELALVAIVDDEVAGHVMLSYIELVDAAERHRVLSLAPLSVWPDRQRRGIGSALVREALLRADSRAEPLVCLEGSPAYYGRLGFEDSRGVGIVFALPDWAPANAGQIYRLGHYHDGITGSVVYPPAFSEAEALRSKG